MDLAKGAEIIKSQLDQCGLNSKDYGVALRYVLYYMANSSEHHIEITKERLVAACAEGVKFSKEQSAL